MVTGCGFKMETSRIRAKIKSDRIYKYSHTKIIIGKETRRKKIIGILLLAGLFVQLLMIINRSVEFSKKKRIANHNTIFNIDKKILKNLPSPAWSHRPGRFDSEKETAGEWSRTFTTRSNH
jgi:hypothetical protein